MFTVTDGAELTEHVSVM